MNGHIRCERCELEAVNMASIAGLGVSAWPTFIDCIAPCDDCRLQAALAPPTRPAPRPTRVSVSIHGERSES